MGERATAPKIAAMKERGERIVCLTAYDALFGRIADEAGVDLILVGDSVANAALGFETTLPITLEEMLHHTRATRRGVTMALLVGDMPFGSYQSSTSQAVDSAVAFMKAGAEAIKLEGDYPEAIAAIVRAGIPVVGHVGFTPQSVNLFGGHKVQGRGASGDEVIRQAKSIQDAGAFALVLELVPAALACEITKALRIPTIGIGAGIGCDGQIQVLYDVLGLSPEGYRHAKPYAQGRAEFAEALTNYAAEVRSGDFPDEAHSF